MRGILIDWLVEVAEEYRLEAETLHLSVNHIDHFLSCTAVLLVPGLGGSVTTRRRLAAAVSAATDATTDCL